MPSTIQGKKSPISNETLRARFGAPSLYMPGKRHWLFVAPGNLTGLAFVCGEIDGNFACVQIGPLTLRDDLSPKLVCELLAAECGRLRWTPEAIVIESPMPKMARRWARPASIATKGVELFAKQLRVPLHRRSRTDVTRLFGAERAGLSEILFAMRRRVGFGLYAKPLLALAIGLAMMVAK